MYLKVLKPFPESHSIGNGIAILNDSINVHIRSEVNGMRSLEFDVPNDSQNTKYLLGSDFWIDADDEWYFVINITQDNSTHLLHVTCRHIIALLSLNNKIEIFPILVNTTAEKILQKAFELSKETFFGLLSNSDLPSGMEWVDDKTDVVNGWDLVSIYEIVSNVIQLIGYGELYIQGTKFAVVKRIGKDKNILFTPPRNVDNVKIEINSNEIINEVLVLGQNDMPLDLEKYPDSIMKSEESIKKYGVRKGTLKIETQDKTELENKAKWELSDLNPDRIDMPKVSISVSAIDLGDKLNLGDGIRVIDKELDLDVIKRIVAIDYWPNDLAQNKLDIGDAALTMEQLLSKLELTRETLSTSINTSGEITPEGIQQLTPYLQNSKNFVYNSSFEIYDNEIPKYWDCNGGAKISRDSQNYGTCSLHLPPKGSVIQSENASIPVKIYESESNSTMVFMSHKWGSVKVTIVDNEGNPVPHKTKFDTKKVDSTVFPYDIYYRNFLVLTFLHEDIKSSDKRYRIQIENVDSVDAYIDGVMSTPNKDGFIPLYRNGAFSDGNYMGQDLMAGSETKQFQWFNSLTQPVPFQGTGIIIRQTIPVTSLPSGDFNVSLSANISFTNIPANALIYCNMMIDGTSVVIPNIQSGVVIPNDFKSFTCAKKLTNTGKDIEVLINIGSSVKGWMVMNGSGINVIVSKIDKTRKLLDTWNLGNTVPTNILGKVYEEMNGEITLEISGSNTDSISYSTWNNIKSGSSRQLYLQIQHLVFMDDKLTEIPSSFMTHHQGLIDVKGLSKTKIEDMGQTFSYCTSLVSCDSTPNTLKNAYGTFDGCSSLISAPLLPIGQEMLFLQETFKDCTSLVSYRHPVSCYNGDSVFMGCTALETGPQSVTVTIPAGNFNYFFGNCESLNGEMIIQKLYDDPYYGVFTSNFLENAVKKGTLNLSIADPDMAEYFRNEVVSTNPNITVNK